MTLPLPSPVAVRAADDALENVGVHEDNGTNSGKFVNQYLASVGLGPGAPWCAAFVHFRLMKAAQEIAQPLPQDLPKSGYCPDWKQWAIERGWWVSAAAAKTGTNRPRKGDLHLFYFPTMGRVAHIGIVLEDHVPGSSFFTGVEGNTSDSAGVNREGGEVARKVRSFASLGSGGGFIRIPAGG